MREGAVAGHRGPPRRGGEGWSRLWGQGLERGRLHGGRRARGAGRHLIGQDEAPRARLGGAQPQPLDGALGQPLQLLERGRLVRVRVTARVRVRAKGEDEGEGDGEG